MRWLGLLAVVSVGCTQKGPEFRGEDMTNYFPFKENENGVWRFANDGEGLLHAMIGTITNIELIPEGNEYTMTYVKDCLGDGAGCNEGEIIRELVWKQPGSLGIQLLEINKPGSTLLFDPPLKFAEEFAKKGAVVETETGGVTYTSTLVEFGECPVIIPSFDNCAHITIESSGGDDLVTGEYYVINDFGLVAVRWPDQPGLWKLNTYDTRE